MATGVGLAVGAGDGGAVAEGLAVGTAVGEGVFDGATWCTADPGCVPGHGLAPPVAAGSGASARRASKRSAGCRPAGTRPPTRGRRGVAGPPTASSSFGPWRTDAGHVEGDGLAGLQGVRERDGEQHHRGRLREPDGGCGHGDGRPGVLDLVLARDGGGPVGHGRDRLPAGVGDPDVTPLPSGPGSTVTSTAWSPQTRASVCGISIRSERGRAVPLTSCIVTSEPVAAGLARRRHRQRDRFGLGAGAPRLHGQRLGRARTALPPRSRRPSRRRG